MLGDPDRAARLAAAAQSDSRDLTWSARARTIAEIAESRLRLASAERGAWSGAQFRAWARQSKRWLVHLVRERSFILPPSIALPTAGLLPVERE
jgi:hypothetical protein